MKTYFRYPGSKHWLKSWFEAENIKQRFLSQGQRLVAPFCGALGDVFEVLPDIAILNDKYAPLVNLHNHVKHGFKITIDMSYGRERYSSVVNEYNSLVGVQDPRSYLLEPKKAYRAAENLYYLNRRAWRGLIRVNSKLKWNVPIGTDNSYLLTFDDYATYMKNWHFTYGDYRNVITKPGDFLILDPPYDPIDGKSFSSYAGNKFTWEDQISLLKWAIATKSQFMICNHATERIVALYQQANLNITYKPRKRSINSNNELRGKPVMEVLACNFSLDSL